MSFYKAIKTPCSFLNKKRLLSFLKIPNVKVSSVKEYFLLPKKEREYFGFYKLPWALPWDWDSRSNPKTDDGWDAFYVAIKKEYPVQYFFRRWLFSTDNPVVYVYLCYFYWPLRDIKYNIKRWFNPVHPRWRASLPRYAYSDISELVISSNFALIRDFYWEEIVDGVVDWEGDDSHKQFHKQIKEYVDWIENELPQFEERYSKALKKASNLSGEYNIKYKETIAMEKEKEDKETEILTWFIKNRGFFWT